MLALSIGSTLLASRARADNPIIQTNYTADPAPMVHEGRLYLYTSHDEDVTRNNFYTMDDWRLYSTIDMVNWTDHGSPAHYENFSWATGDAWAPQGIARNGQFYFYVPLNNNTGARIGVGVSSNIAGPFTDPLGKELVGTGTGHIDPTVFIDDDDQAYMYWGNGTLRYVKLNSDMISVSGSPTTVSLQGFTEGPWFYKRESRYYLVYAAISGTEKISYATSDSPTGPWTYRGDIMGPGSTFTNHAGVVDYQGHSYFFYHNNALPGGGDFKRSVCVEEFSYGADGSIPPITMSSEGPSAIATLDPFQQVEAETIAFSSGLKTEVCTDTGAGMNVTSIHDGDYIKVKDVDFLDGVTSFEARVSSATQNATIELHLDSETGTSLGTCDVSGASSWTTVTCPVSGGAGKHDLFLRFTGGDGELFKFNWWKFTGPTTTTDGGGEGGTAGVGGSAGTSSTTAGGTGGADSTTGSSFGGASSTTGSSVGTVDGGVSASSTGAGTFGGDTSTTSGSSVGGAGATAVGPTNTSTATAATNSAPADASNDGDDAGCSCRAGGSARSSGLGVLLVFAGTAIAAGQRRRRSAL